jgi:hypothetical protein
LVKGWKMPPSFLFVQFSGTELGIDLGQQISQNSNPKTLKISLFKTYNWNQLIFFQLVFFLRASHSAFEFPDVNWTGSNGNPIGNSRPV